MFYLLPHKVGMQYWNLLAKLHKIEKRPMLYNGVFGCHGNTCCVILIGDFFFMIHSIVQ